MRTKIRSSREHLRCSPLALISDGQPLSYGHPPGRSKRSEQARCLARVLRYRRIARRSSFAKDLTTRIADILDALSPHLDDELITEFGQFFASVASSELSELGRSDLWHLPASKLSAGQLQDFSVKKKSQEISLVAPGLSSFLNSICAGKKTASDAATDDDETDLHQIGYCKSYVYAHIIFA